MKIKNQKHTYFLGSLSAFLLLTEVSFGQGETLKDDLVSYWPFDEILGNKTPDLKSGLDMVLRGFPDNANTADDDEEAGLITTGQRGNALRFRKVENTLAARVHDVADDLPANKHPSFTISMWARVTSVGQNDLRVLAEGSTTQTNPIFTLGTRQGTDANGSLDLFIRDFSGADTGHLRTTAELFDGVDWRHLVYVQTTDPDTSVMTRQVYIDGVLDSLVIPVDQIYAPTDMNTTAIGGLLRSAPGALIDGDFDEVAIWKRALTEAEIIDVRDNGIPDLDEVQDDLVINDFKTEYRVVAAGDEIQISWDATKDATLSITPGIGDVTALGEFGVGNTTVVVTEPTTFTLTASRDGEPNVVSTVDIAPISGVATNWNWIENFDDLSPDAPLGAQGDWIVTEGGFNVVTIGDTNALRQDGSRALTGRDLGTHGIPERSTGTFFFRFCVSEELAALPINLKMGLTEKGFRVVDDWADNIGTYITFNRPAEGELQLQAIDGIGGELMDSGLTFDIDRSYDVWIDVTNNALDDSETEPDRFSVHVAPTGGNRVTVFDNIVSDREPGEVFLLGFPQPTIDSIFIVSTSAGQGINALAFDDFYMSTPGTQPGTAPIPSGFGKIEAGRPEITAFSYNPDTRAAELTWNSQPNTNYAVEITENLTEMTTWIELEDSIATQGASTTLSLVLPPDFPKALIRVIVE